MREIEQIVFRRVFLKYRIMTVRAKISFMAMYRRMTVHELIVTTIKRCYQQLVELNCLTECSKNVIDVTQHNFRGSLLTIIERNFDNHPDNIDWLK